MDGKKGRSRRRRRRRGRKTKIEDLCDNMTVEILRSLPLRSIIRCLVVCKRWQSLIACNPLFKINTINVVTGYDGQFDTYRCLERGQRGGGIQQISELDLSFGFPNKRGHEILQCTGHPSRGYELYDYRILASCNGLHFSCYFFREYSVWGGINKFEECYISNPWTKECARLPNPIKLSYDSPFGLAFENNSSDDNVALYKIVIVSFFWSYRNKTNYSCYKFEMYSSNKKKWQWLQTSSEPECGYRCDFSEKLAVYCNRVLYWQCTKKYHALMFNLETETSGFLDLPGDNDADEKLVKSKLIECDGQLHFIRIDSAGRRLNIWKMSMSSGGGGWLMLHNIDLEGAVESNLGSFQLFGIERELSNLRPIGMSCEGDDKVLLHNNYNNDDDYEQIVSYDLKKGVFELVLQRKLKYLNYGWKLFRYTPTTKFIS